jgi:hypothetical protein
MSFWRLIHRALECMYSNRDTDMVEQLGLRDSELASVQGVRGGCKDNDVRV